MFFILHFGLLHLSPVTEKAGFVILVYASTWPWVPSVQKARADGLWLSPLLMNPTGWQSCAFVQSAHPFHCRPLGCLMLHTLLPRPTCCRYTELVLNTLLYSRGRLQIRSLNPTPDLLNQSICGRAQESVLLNKYFWILCYGYMAWTSLWETRL